MIWDWAGGRLELTPNRIMQVTLQGKDAFWTAGDADGWNVGGDRLWLGPERDWFWAGDDPDDLSAHQVPRAIDPGEWRTFRATRGLAEFTAEPLLRNRTTGATTHAAVIRQVHLAYADNIRVVYEVHTSVRILAGPPAQELSAWSVLQIPTGGLLEFSLSGPFTYRDYLRPVDPSRFTVGDGLVGMKLTGDTMSKIGVTPAAFAGNIRYTHGDLVIDREMNVQPQSRYCDHPLGADRSGQGDALQVFEDDGHYGGYAEIEHHSPAAAVGGPNPIVDVCRTTVTLR